MCIAAAESAHNLLSENHRLKIELNTLRSHVMGPSALQVEMTAVDEALNQLFDVRREALGVFKAGCGENCANPGLESVWFPGETVASDPIAGFQSESFLGEFDQLDPLQANICEVPTVNEPHTFFHNPYGKSLDLENDEDPWIVDSNTETSNRPSTFHRMIPPHPNLS